MKHKLLTLAGALALLATLGHFYAKPLLAQVRAALVQNMDEPGRHPYQATIAWDPTVNFIVNFADVPVGQRLVVQQVMVEAKAGDVNNFGALRLFVGKTSPFTQVFQEALQTGGSVFPTRQLSTPLTAYVDGGQHVVAEFDSVRNGANPVTITLIGHLVDCSAAGSCAAIVE